MVMDFIRKQLNKEREMIGNGNRPRPFIQNPLQRSAARYLVVFLCVITLFTVISRMADGVTVARVETDTVKAGFLTHRAKLNGVFEPVRELEMNALTDIRVIESLVKTGQTINQGDELLELDMDEIRDKLEQLKNEQQVRRIKLELLESGITSDDGGAVVEAQLNLTQAKSDYDALLLKLERDNLRAEQDLEEAKQSLEDAEADYQKVYGKTKDELIKAAREKLDKTRENLELAKETAYESISGVKYTYDSAVERDKSTLSAAENNLADAKEKLDAAKKAYDKAVENSGKQSDAYYNAVNSYSFAQSRLSAAIKRLSELENDLSAEASAISAAKAEVASAEKALEAAEAKIDSFDLDDTSGVDAAQEQLKAAQKAYDRAKSAVSDGQKPSLETQRAKTVLEDAKEKQEKSIQKAEEALEKAERELAKLESNEDFSDENPISTAEQTVKQAQKALNTAERTYLDNQLLAEEKITTAKRSINDAENQLEKARKQAEANIRDTKRSQKQSEADSLALSYEIRMADKNIGFLEELTANGGKILSPASGVVLNIAENGLVAKNNLLCKLSLSESGFTFTAKLKEKDAKYLTLGDKGFLEYSDKGQSKRIEAAISSISPPDENGDVEVISHLSAAAYPVKSSGQWVISKQSDKQAACLPLSALHSDTVGEYVLVVHDKKTVLGNEQTVARVPITVVSRDSEKMSVEGPLMRSDLVVISSNKPITEGDRVFVQGS